MDKGSICMEYFDIFQFSICIKIVNMYFDWSGNEGKSV